MRNVNLQLDHVAFGWSNHSEIIEILRKVGLDPEYGGEHADGTTQMSLLGFADGTYLELISPIGETTPERWPEFLTTNGGPCAFAVSEDDAAEAAKRAINAGIPVDGPHRGGREREDGTYIEWDECYLGAGDARSVLPFVVADRTPRSYRVTPTPAVSNGSLTGIAEVIVAVADLSRWLETVERLYRLPAPYVRDDRGFNARVARFPGSPLTLAEPSDGTLADRLNRYGPAPCACLLGTESDLSEACSIREPRSWFDRKLAWLDNDRLAGKLGVIH